MEKEILDTLQKETEMELAVKGRVSGKVTTRPVWFVLSKDKNSILLVPVNGKSTQWYLNVIKDPNVRVKVGHHSLTGRIRELGAERLKEVLDLFVAKYGKEDIDQYYPRKEVALEIPIESLSSGKATSGEIK
jgi:hypothetical protein